jgi:hypothetical protein
MTRSIRGVHQDRDPAEAELPCRTHGKVQSEQSLWAAYE